MANPEKLHGADVTQMVIHNKLSFSAAMFLDKQPTKTEQYGHYLPQGGMFIGKGPGMLWGQLGTGAAPTMHSQQQQ